MPIYGYECGQCGHHFEVMQRMSEEPLRTCPECSGPLRKLLYPVGVIFKGSGFYSTDYKTSSANGSSSSESAGDSKAAPGGDAGGKPESKAGSPGEAKGEAKAEGTAQKKPEKKADAKPATD